MSELVIETSDLRKVYRSGLRRHAALDGLDLEVRRTVHERRDPRATTTSHTRRHTPTEETA